MAPSRRKGRPWSGTRRRRSARRAPVTGPADVLMQFRMIIRTIRQHYRHVQERCGVSGAHLWALAAVGTGSGIKVKDVARHLAIHQSTASNLLDKLERMNMVERRRSDDDRRVVCVYITAAGRALLRRAPKPMQGVLPDALQALSASELRALHAQLDAVIRRMHVHVPSGGMTPLSRLLERDDSPAAANKR